MSDDNSKVDGTGKDECNSQESAAAAVASSTVKKKSLEAVPEEAMAASGGHQPTFHIPESNASDFAPSECSSHYRRDWQSNQLTKTEALSGSQHVVLWLTRTSMSDIPSVPSLKNLVQSSIFGQGNSSSAAAVHRGAGKPHKSSLEEKSYNPIQRNFSTKSFLKLHKDEEDTAAAASIRKCETVIALSGMSSSSSNKSNSASMAAAATRPPKVKSPLQVFKHLASSRLLPQDQPRRSSVAANEASIGCESPYPGIQPRNRLRSAASSVICSRCTSVVSVNHSRVASRCHSQISLHRKSKSEEPSILCKICLVDYSVRDAYRIQQCHCIFCKECLYQYLSFEIMSGAYEISCPDSQCGKEGIFTLEEIEKLVGKDLLEKHKNFRLNTEVALDSNRAWCPKPGCNTICHICASATNLNNASARAVQCPQCDKEFCSSCSSSWHPGLTCQEYGKKLVMQNMTPDSSLLIDPTGDGNIKQCPMCHVPIERDAGCAQMMCKRCKHVFCWFCLSSLDDDFLLRHYDSGKCKGKLGHTRASLLWHRAQVIGIFAGFVVLLLVASPLLLVAAPCIFCCRCKSCTELEEELDPNSPSKTSRSNSGIAIQIMKD